MGVLTKEAMDGYRDYTERTIAYAKYKAAGGYHRTGKPSISTLPDGRLAVDVIIDHSIAGDITVTEIQLYNTADKLWLAKPESIKRKSAQEGILYRLTFTILES